MGDLRHTVAGAQPVTYITADQFELLARLAMKKGGYGSFQKLRRDRLPNRLFLSFKFRGDYVFRRRQEYGTEYVFHSFGVGAALPLDDPNNRIAVSILVRIADGHGDDLAASERVCEDVARLLLVVAEEQQVAETQNQNAEDQRD